MKPNLRVKGTVSLDGVTMDLLLLDTGLLDEREELASAVRVALGTDAVADETDILPDPDSTDRRGWWGDMDAAEIWGGWPIGCKNWLLTRAKITDIASSEGSTIERAKHYTLSALQPFVDQRMASAIEVDAQKMSNERIDVDALIYRGPEEEIDLRFQLMWQEEAVYEGPTTPKPVGKFFRIPYRTLTITSTPPLLRIKPITGQLVLTGHVPTMIRT